MPEEMASRLFSEWVEQKIDQAMGVLLQNKELIEQVRDAAKQANVSVLEIMRSAVVAEVDRIRKKHHLAP